VSETISLGQRCRGCLLGGAVGDALGAPIEFMSSKAINRHFGQGGIRDFAPAYGRLGAITDDTQMTLFTAEGVLRASVRYAARGICHPATVVHHAYMRWLKTQGESPSLDPQADLTCEVGMDGWLITVPALWSRRAPGNTCLSALRKAEQLGKPATNNSKGCGGVMRASPVGLVANCDRAFELGSDTAALTHGHPSGFLSAGFLALMIERLISGASLRDSIHIAKRGLITHPGHEEVLGAIEQAEVLADQGITGVRVEALGQGWVAEEALAIALYCALVAPTLEEAVVIAVNHSGDSDSTGAITGNICGALYGEAAIPARWLESLELREEITAIADDLTGLRQDTLHLDSDLTWIRYPGW
jgi:ADP-ribosyl-[dinitrogen reductase] hydrolase